MRKVAEAALLLMAIVAGAAQGSAAAAGMALFASTEAAAPADERLPQWRRVLREIGRGAELVAACRRLRDDCPNTGTARWLDMLQDLAGAPRLEQIHAVHHFVNRWRYRSDLDNYAQSDRWAAPVDFFGRSGDCEDYAIAKYVSLRRLGLPQDQLRLVVLEDTIRDLAHAVLAVELDGEVWILDNLQPAPRRQAELPHYVPYYSLNEAGRWVHAPVRSAGVATAADDR